VVDDDLDMCWVLKVILESSGHSVTIAQSGDEAFDVAAESTFHVAFIDVRLPDIDGLQLATKLKQLYSLIKIIIISGYYFEDDLSIVEAVLAMRVNGFLAKPFQIEAIEAALGTAS
jgi:CheY-like chemotaxis protein